MLYELLDIDKSRWATHLDNAWQRSVLGKFFCKECYKLDRSRYPQPIDARLKSISPGISIGAVFGACVGIIHVRLFEVLSPYMTGFVFGNCYNADSALIEEYRTWYGKTYIEPRGEEGSTWKTCPACGVLKYRWEGDPYVLSYQVGEEHVYHDAICSLYVDEWLARTVDWSAFKDFELYPFPVRDRPLDGFRLPGDPDWSALAVE